MNIFELFEQQARERPRQPAIVETTHQGEQSTDYDELHHAVLQSCTLFERHGLMPGDAVLLFQPMSVALYVYLLACFRLGLVAMFIDPGVGRDYITQCCRIHPPRALLAAPGAQLLRLLSPSLRRIPVKFTTGHWFPFSKSARWHGQRLTTSPVVAGGDAIALISFTSATTGAPKAIARSHDFLLAQNHVLRQSLALRPGQVDMNSLPIFVLANLATGLTSIIPAGDLRHPAAVDGATLLRQLEHRHAQRLSAPPSLIERLVAACERDGQRLQWPLAVYTGGAPVFPQLLQRLAGIAPLAQIHVIYGSSEAEPIAQIEYREISSSDFEAMRLGRGLLAGKPIAGIALRILAPHPGENIATLTPVQLDAMTLQPNAVGEILVSGEHVLTGYLHGSGDQETKIRVGDTIWHRSGDAGYLDNGGRLWLLGRDREIVRDGHGEAYPFPIECAALQAPGIQRAAFLLWRQRRCLVVQCADAAAVRALDELRRREHIDAVMRIDRMPLDRRHNAKIDYPALRRWLTRHTPHRRTQRSSD